MDEMDEMDEYEKQRQAAFDKEMKRRRQLAQQAEQERPDLKPWIDRNKDQNLLQVEAYPPYDCKYEAPFSWPNYAVRKKALGNGTDEMHQTNQMRWNDQVHKYGVENSFYIERDAYYENTPSTWRLKGVKILVEQVYVDDVPKYEAYSYTNGSSQASTNIVIYYPTSDDPNTINYEDDTVRNHWSAVNRAMQSNDEIEFRVLVFGKEEGSDQPNRTLLRTAIGKAKVVQAWISGPDLSGAPSAKYELQLVKPSEAACATSAN